ARLPHDSLARSAHGPLRSASQIRSDLARRIFRGALVCTRVSYVNFARSTEGKTYRERAPAIRLRRSRRAVHGKAQGRATTAAALSPLCDRSRGDPVRRRGAAGRRAGRLDAGWRPTLRCRRHSTAFTRATISHCNGVCRSDCERQWVRKEHISGKASSPPYAGLGAVIISLICRRTRKLISAAADLAHLRTPTRTSRHRRN